MKKPATPDLPSTDIVERLRIRQPLLGKLCDEAADEIERLNQDREKYFLDNLEMKAEIERLTVEKASAFKTQDLMANEIERLRAALQEFQPKKP